MGEAKTDSMIKRTIAAALKNIDGFVFTIETNDEIKAGESYYDQFHDTTFTIQKGEQIAYSNKDPGWSESPMCLLSQVKDDSE